VTGPVLFDVTVGGKLIKGVASGGKNCFLYIWNRETGQPINPMVETAVLTKTTCPARKCGRRSRSRITAKGVPMQPFCATFPIVADPERAKRARPMFYPYSTRSSSSCPTGARALARPPSVLERSCCT